MESLVVNRKVAGKVEWTVCLVVLVCSFNGKGQDCGIQFSDDTTENSSKRIMGGQSCHVSRWPWQVALISDGEQVCGGSLITSDWIVTAAHCFDKDAIPTHWSVIAGERNLKVNASLKRSLEISNIYLHPQYTSNAPTYEFPSDYDVAMVLLKQKLLLTSCTFPICLMPNDARFLPGTTCYVTGWGRLATNGPHPTMLQEAQVPLVSRELCNNPEIYNGLIHERALCAGSAEGGVGPCQFDSGGPLACQESGVWYLSGVVSWGVGCGEPNKLGVYSDMSVLMDWVKDMVATDASFI
ncbi:serine protease hepsin-like [Pocillopora verrucosa]|uniref:serine protease hepsin-like n=1 Tax=Pocillopora verrucosa TaxID=203993 RepID=UPI003341B475